MSFRSAAARLHAAGREVLPSHYRLMFAATYAYSPRGATQVSKRSQSLCSRLKSGQPHWLRGYVQRVLEQTSSEACLRGFFAARAMLVPVPTSAVSRDTGRWTAHRLAAGLQAMGLGSELWSGLRRATPVGKSAIAWMHERPTVPEHFRSFVFDDPAVLPAQIVLIDDVITKGRTLIAAALRIQQSLPRAQIRAFALVRTMGLIAEVPSVIAPCRGELRWDGRDVQRVP